MHIRAQKKPRAGEPAQGEGVRSATYNAGNNSETMHTNNL